MTFHNKWRSFLHGSKKVNLKEEVQRVAENLPWSEESVGSEIKRAKELDGEFLDTTPFDADVVYNYITMFGDGDVQKAYDEVEALLDIPDALEILKHEFKSVLRGEEQSAEIEDLMSQEDEELKFTEKWNAGEDVDDPWETEL
jgi:hypothetical protein